MGFAPAAGCRVALVELALSGAAIDRLFVAADAAHQIAFPRGRAALNFERRGGVKHASYSGHGYVVCGVVL